MSESPHMPDGVTCTEIFHNIIMPAPSSNPIDQLLFLVFAFCRYQLTTITAKYQKDNLIETEYKRGVYKILSNELAPISWDFAWARALFASSCVALILEKF